METKPIMWRNNGGMQGFCGAYYIGGYTEMESGLLYVSDMFGNKNMELDSIPEARLWVETQFQNFIKEISA